MSWTIDLAAHYAARPPVLSPSCQITSICSFSFLG